MDYEKKTEQILKEKCGITKEVIEPSDRLEYELEMDSTDRFELQYHLEQEFCIPQDETDGDITGEMSFRELVAYVKNKVEPEEETK